MTIRAVRAAIFVCAAIGADWSASETRRLRAMMMGRRFDQLAICEMAAENRLLAALHWALSERELLQHLEAEFRDALEIVARANRSRNEGIVAQAWAVARILRDRGIAPLFVKSAADLLRCSEPTLAGRTMADIDIVVRPQEEEEAGRALLEHGYEKVPNAYVRPGEPAAVDLRSCLLYGIAFDGVSDECLLERSLEIRGAAGESAAVLEPSAAILHHFVHSEIHHEGYADGVIRHPTLFDVTHTARKSPDIDWAWIRSVAERSGYRNEIRRFLQLLDALYRWNPHGYPQVASPSMFVARTFASARIRVVEKTAWSLSRALRRSLTGARGDGSGISRRVRRLVFRYCRPANIVDVCRIHYRAADWRRTKRRMESKALQIEDACG